MSEVGHFRQAKPGVTLLMVAHAYWEEDSEEVIRMISARKATRQEGEPMKKLTKSQAGEIRALRRIKDEEIDLTDIPEVTNWSNAVVGKFYRPIKKSLTIRIDADVLVWLKGQGRGYQTRINGLLREAMEGVSSGKLLIRLTEYGMWPGDGRI